jgi:hypothetical protein
MSRTNDRQENFSTWTCAEFFTEYDARSFSEQISVQHTLEVTMIRFTSPTRETLERRSGVANALLILVGLGVALSAQAEEPFNRGTTTASIHAGIGRALDQTYTTLGGGIGTMVSDGLLLAVNGEIWVRNSFEIFKVTPEVRYIFPTSTQFKPYVGGFVSRTFYDDQGDRFTYGARGGVYHRFSSNAAFNIGLVHEHIFDCDKNVYKKCQQLYPEAGITFSLR